MTKPLISIVSPTYNEEQNVAELHTRICNAVAQYEGKYEFEIIIIDNCSEDNTVRRLTDIAKKDPRVKIIVNVRKALTVRAKNIADKNRITRPTKRQTTMLLPKMKPICPNILSIGRNPGSCA